MTDLATLISFVSLALNARTTIVSVSLLFPNVGPSNCSKLCSQWETDWMWQIIFTFYSTEIKSVILLFLPLFIKRLTGRYNLTFPPFLFMGPRYEGPPHSCHTHNKRTRSAPRGTTIQPSKGLYSWLTVGKVLMPWLFRHFCSESIDMKVHLICITQTTRVPGAHRVGQQFDGSKRFTGCAPC